MERPLLVVVLRGPGGGELGCPGGGVLGGPRGGGVVGPLGEAPTEAEGTSSAIGRTSAEGRMGRGPDDCCIGVGVCGWGGTGLGAGGISGGC